MIQILYSKVKLVGAGILDNLKMSCENRGRVLQVKVHLKNQIIDVLMNALGAEEAALDHKAVIAQRDPLTLLLQYSLRHTWKQPI